MASFPQVSPEIVSSAVNFGKLTLQPVIAGRHNSNEVVKGFSANGDAISQLLISFSARMQDSNGFCLFRNTLFV